MAYLRGDPPAFVFLIHPRDIEDLYCVPGARIIKEHSVDAAQFTEKMLSLPATIIGDFTFGFSPIRGEALGVLRMPEQIMFATGRDRIEEAVRVAAGRGARVLGLGALTAPATRGGLTLLPMLPRGLTLTTGNAYTAAVARRNVVEASEVLGIGPDAVVAVVGCTGSVGVAAARLLDVAGFRLILIGRSVTRVHKELADLVEKSTVSGRVADIATADVVLLVTGDPTARIPASLPKPGSVVVDLAHPVNIEHDQYPVFALRDVRVAQGGLVHIPGFSCGVNMRLVDRTAALACLTETYLFARAGITQHAVGQAAVGTAIELEAIAADYGIRVRSLGLDAATEDALIGGRS
jgi:fatty aldehyde-generating acyl-ACP reductase